LIEHKSKGLISLTVLPTLPAVDI